MKQKTKRAAIFSTSITAVIVMVFSLAYVTANAANRFNFSGQGIVSENNVNDKHIRVTFKQISKQAASLAGTEPVTVRVNRAKIYKTNAAGALLPARQDNVGVGLWVTLNGAVKSDNSFSASKVTIVPRKFKIRGKLIAIRKDSKIMTVEISASTYQPAKYVGKTQEISYTDTLTVLHSGGKKNIGKVESLNQRVIIDGNIVGDSQFEAVQLNDPL